jgi:hypothetical protein
MGRLAGVTVAMLVSAGSAWPALAGERGPVCREPSVVDVMTREIRNWAYYSRVDPRLVTEVPTTDTRFVICQVCVLVAPYDMSRFGDRPLRQCMAQSFEVQILSSGFVVRDLSR